MVKPFEKKVWLSSPSTYDGELRYVTEAIELNWVSTVGANINAVEDITCQKVG